MTKLSTKFKKRFEGICHQLLIEGYQIIRANRSCSNKWDEENISAHFIDNMENNPIAIDNKIDIRPEIRVYTNAIINQGVKAKTASRIDIYFFRTTWSNPKQEEGYAVEAKNISQNSWKKNKADKNPVNVSQQKTEYITKGIDDFIQGNYPQGCMIAYVVQGNISNIITDINQRIKKRPNYPSKIGQLTKTTPILNFTEIYDSKCVTPSNKKGQLKHFFFDLT